MPTNRNALRRRGLSLDEFQISEALSGRSPLLGGEGFGGDVQAIRLAWQLHGPQLMRLWRRFADWRVKEPRPAVPPGYQMQVEHAK